MTERTIIFLAVLSLIAAIVLGILGEFFRSASLLFSVLLSVIGIVAGFFISKYFDRRSEQQNLGKLASAGYRLTLDIYDSLSQIKEKIEETKLNANKKGYSKRELNLLLDCLTMQLLLIQRFSFAANNQWRDVLPPDQKSELNERQQVISLSANTE